MKTLDKILFAISIPTLIVVGMLARIIKFHYNVFIDVWGNE